VVNQITTHARPLQTRSTDARFAWPANTVRGIIAISLVTLVCILGLTLLIPHRPISGDALFYLHMAVQPTRFTAAPWGYRLLTPWLIHILPLPPLTGFFVVTVLGLSMTAITIGLLCSSIGLSRRGVMTAPILFLCSYAGVYNLYNFALVDALAYAGTTLCLLFLARTSFRAAAFCVLVTTIDKEWGIFLIPILALALWRLHGTQAAAVLSSAIIGGVAPVLFYLLIRHWPGFGGHAYSNYYDFALVRQMLFLHSSDIIPTLLDANVSLWILAPLGWRAAHPTLRISTLLVPAAMAQLLFATDGTRMLVYTYPCLIPLALAALDRLSFWRWAISLCLLLIAGSHLLLMLLGSSATFIDVRFVVLTTLTIVALQANKRSPNAAPHPSDRDRKLRTILPEWRRGG